MHGGHNAGDGGTLSRRILNSLKKERGAVVYFFVIVDMYYTRSPSGDILRDLTDHRSKVREGRLVFTWQLNAVSQSRINTKPLGNLLSDAK